MNNIQETVHKIHTMLHSRNQTITFAESCTGGLVAATYCGVAGVSSSFKGSVVSYANEIKSSWLGVDETTLATHGAVSKECVAMMAKGALKMANAHYAISISGIAGPDGGSKDKPVGTVFFAIASNETLEVYKERFAGGRQEVQRQSMEFALKKVEIFIKNQKAS